MQEWGLGAGLAAIAFWMFIAAISVAGVWDGIRKCATKHQTVRRLIESGQDIDSELMDKLMGLTDNKSERPDHMFFIIGFWILPVFAVGGDWAEWLLTRVNSIAGVLVLGFKGYRVLYKKVLRGARLH